MKTKKFNKRILSLMLAMLICITGILPAATALGADGVEGYYDIELFYKDSSTIVPSFLDDGETTYIEYMVEGQELNLTYKLIDTEMPNNGYIKWYSETPSLVDVTQEGVVKAFDSSKGAVVQSWIDNEVKTIPLVGSIIATVIEKVIFNEYVDLDTMDTDAIVALVEGAFGSESVLDKWIESYQGELVESLRHYLDNINSNIHVQLFDADGTLLDDDFVQICVTKNTEWYANFLPNGTHITNKSQINTTVAVGSTAQIYAVTTPLRLKYGCIYSIKSSSIFDQGKVVATVNDSGLVTFKNTGTVTVIVSPDTEQIIENILKLVNYFYALDNTGTIDSDKIAGILIDYVGLDMNRTVLAGILDVCFAIKDIAGDAADPVQLTATAIEIISNLVLQFVYNDSITFTVVEAQPITDFNIEGADTVKEGSQIALEIADVQPSTGDTSDITWRSSDPSIASIDPETGVITGRDAGGLLGNLSTQKCTIYATSAANNIERSFTLTVTGKTGKYLSDVEIQGEQYLEMGEESDYTYAVYPNRVATSDNLYISWGILTGEDEEGNPTYIWADEENPADNGIGKIDSKGHYVANDGGLCTIAVKATTGYYITSSNFYEISSYTDTFEITNGVPIENIRIDATAATSNGSLNKVQTVEINGEEYTYVTIKKSLIEAYAGNGAVLSASVYPENASNQTLHWVVDNTYYNTEISDDYKTCSVKQKAGHEVADTFNIYAASEDGQIKSNVITVCVTRNYATSNSIDQESIEITNGKTASATHSMGYDGSWDSTAYVTYKCNWYSSDPSVFTVESQGNTNRDALLTAVDVGTATLYCVSADGGIVDTCQVTVYPDKEYLENIVNLCDKTIVKRTSENASLYKQYMRKLDLAYSVLYDYPMVSQTVCDTYARELLYAFYKIGGFVNISNVNILGANNSTLSGEHVTVSVSSTGNYTKYSYDFGYSVYPKNAMYSDIQWSSSNDSITVDKNGTCTPSSNNSCSAIITCSVKDYMGVETSQSVFLSFARTAVTGITLDTTEIVGGKIGETQTITPTVLPKGTLGVGGASCNSVYYSSSNEEIASVDQNGVITFVEGGDCIIYCTTFDGGYTAECKVNVVTNYSALSLLITQYTDLALNSVNYYPDSWAVYSDAMTKASGMVANGGYSQNEVDQMYADLEKAYNSLEKYNYIQKIELYLDGEATQEFYQYDLSLLSEGISYKNAILDLNVRLYPNNGSYASVEWSSSTTDIAVTQDGKCSPTINDSCWGAITCKVTDHFGNEFTDSVWVSYSYVPVTALVLSQTTLSGAIGTTDKLTCTVQPTGTSLLGIGAASIKDFYWESDNEDIATIDAEGNVTFVSAGSTVVRAVSYDGGISAECVVSCEGDRTALRAALAEYESVDYTQFEYDYAITFKAAYEKGQEVMTDNSVTQDDIDNTTLELNNAYAAMAEHPYIFVENISMSYVSYKRPLVGSASQVTSGSVSTNDALSINLKDDYSNYNNYNDVTLTAGTEPTNAMYKSITFNVDSSNKMDSSVSEASITLTPTDRNNGGWAIITITATDHFDRTCSRTITVVMSDTTATGFDITESTLSVYATAQSQQIAYSVAGSPEFANVIWTSSNEEVVTVDANGIITPVDKGSAVVTGKTLDGGFTDTVQVTVSVDFSALAAKQVEYFSLIEDVKDSYTYTEDSLTVLSACVAEAQAMINENKATQAQVNQMIEKLDNAYNSLVEYVATTGVAIGYQEQTGVSSENEGFIRFTNTVSLNAKTVNLVANPQPEGSVYSEISWSSSSSTITVSEDGVVTNNSASAGVAKITCTVKNVFGGEYSTDVYVSFVRFGATGISFADEMVFGAPAQTAELAPIITNSNNSNLSSAVVKACSYTSSDTSVATVDENGVVTFISQGEAVITATALDGGYTAQITAYTTWDTAALKGAIDSGANITYTDYAYEYGTAFKTAYENANTVYRNVYASQEEIDLACTALTEAISNLEGNEFVAPQAALYQNAQLAESGAMLEIDENSQVVLALNYNENAMYKSYEITAVNGDGITGDIKDNQITITKTTEKGTITITVKTVDTYDRETVQEFTYTIIDTPIPATDIALYADGEEIVDSSLVVSCGGRYTNFADIQLSYLPTPSTANSITNVEYTSSRSTYISVDDNGLISITTLGKMSVASSQTATITCTITNLDGSTVTKAFNLTITRA